MVEKINQRLGASTPQTTKADPTATSRPQETASQVFKGKTDLTISRTPDSGGCQGFGESDRKTTQGSESTMKFMQGSLWNRGFLGKSDTLNKAEKKK